MSEISQTGSRPSRAVRLPERPSAALALAGGLASLPTVVLVLLVVGPEARALLAALGALAVGTTLSCLALARDAPHDRLGLANLVTLTRLVVVSVLTAPLVSGSDPAWVILLLAVIALALDGVDGWIARRQNLTSRFGARFDMEVDCALALVLSVHAMIGSGLGPAVLLLGIPRYVYGLAGRALPWMQRELPERRSRKAVCVLQLATLIAVQVPILPDEASRPLVVAAAAALILSFGRDILWLWRRRV